MSVGANVEQKPVGYVQLVRENRNFLLLWISQIVSLLGDWFDLIAATTLLVSFHASSTAISALFVVRVLAPFLISPLAGVAADRLNRKALLIFCDVGRGFVVLGFLFVRTPEQAWLLYVITALQTLLTGLWFPARTAILPDIVNRGEIGAANALGSATWSVMLSFGAALGGISVGLVGVYPSFIIDSASFFISAAVTALIAYQFSPHPGQAQLSPRWIFGQYIDGLRYLRQHLDTLFITLQKTALALFIMGAFQVIQTIIAEQIFVIGQGGGTSLGLIYAAVGVGTGFGPMIVRRFTGDDSRRMRIAIGASYGISALGLAITATLLNFPVVLLGSVLRGLGVGITWVFSTQLLFMALPNSVRGRVFATEFALQTLATAVSVSVVGPLLDTPGVTTSEVLLGLAVLTLIPGVLWLVWIFGAGSLAQVAREETPE
jgi:MFS transporter, NRE family, putaive nickel resistance protein